eukprot:462101_1
MAITTDQHMLIIKVVEARNLVQISALKKEADPYVELVLHSKTSFKEKGKPKHYNKTKVMKNTRNPVWNTEFVFKGHVNDFYALGFDVRDKGFLTDPFMGGAMIKLSTLLEHPGRTLDQWIKLKIKAPREKQGKNGELHLKITFEESIAHEETTVTPPSEYEKRLQEKDKIIMEKEEAIATLKQERDDLLVEVNRRIAELNRTYDKLSLAQGLSNDDRNKRKDEEKESDVDHKGLKNVLCELDRDIEVFKQRYNQFSLQQRYNKSPQDLISSDSPINKDIARYMEDTERIVVSTKAFSKYMVDIHLFIKKIAIPNVNEYKSWNLEQIMAWIMSLDAGKYVKVSDQLRNGFIESEIFCGDVLPDLTRGDLSDSPFKIKNFAIKRDLVKHFHSLTAGDTWDVTQNEMAASGGTGNEGFVTEYH